MAEMREHDGNTSPVEENDDPPAPGERLLEATIAAHGGDAFLGLPSLTIDAQGDFITPPQTGGLTIPLSSVTLTIATGGRFRLEAPSMLGRVLIVNRGTTRGGFAFLNGRALQLPAEHLDHLEPTELLRAARRERYPVTVPAEQVAATADGEPLFCYHITPADGGVRHVSVEADTGLVRRVVANTPRGEMTVLLSGYRPGAGMPMFGEIHLLENGASVFRLRNLVPRINTPIRDSLFQQP